MTTDLCEYVSLRLCYLEQTQVNSDDMYELWITC